MFVARPLRGVRQGAMRFPSSRSISATTSNAARPRLRPAPKKRSAEPPSNGVAKGQLPPLALLNAAWRAKALDIEPLAASAVLADYIKVVNLRSKGSWERQFWTEQKIMPKTLVLLALILMRCKDAPRAQLAVDLLVSASAMGEPSATIYLVNQGLQKEKLDLQIFSAPLAHLRALATPPHSNSEAMVLLGKIYESQKEDDKALQMYRRAAATGPAADSKSEFQLPSLGDAVSAALVREAKILQRRGDTARAEALLQEAAIAHDDPEANYQFALLQKRDSPKREEHLLAAAGAGIVPATTSLGEMYLEKARASSSSPAAAAEKASQRKLAKEWLFLGATAGEARSMIALADALLEEGNLKSAQSWVAAAGKSADPDVVDAAKDLTVKLEASRHKLPTTVFKDSPW